MLPSRPLIKLLLADDDADDIDLFKEATTASTDPINLVCVNNGVELLQHLFSGETIFDIVVMDMNMPGKDGLECITEIRTNPSTATLPIIVFSTSDYESRIRESLDAGANHYIVKPSTFEGLLNTINLIYQTAVEYLLTGEKR